MSKTPSSIRPKGSSSSNRVPPVSPMSERQQMALLMQMTSSNNETGSRSPSLSKSRDRNEKGWTPLHEACNHGWCEVALRLIQSGANVNAKGLGDDTPLHDAVVNGHLKLAKILVEYGADLYAKNSKGKSPLDVASGMMKPYLLNTSLSLPEGTASTRPQSRLRDDKKTAAGESSKQKSSTALDDGMESKGGSADGTDDVYEFKSAKDVEPSSAKGAAEISEPDRDTSDPLNVAPAPQTDDSPKRGHSELSEHQEEASSSAANDDENRKKKRKDEAGKGPNQKGAGQGKGTSGKQSGGGQSKVGTPNSGKSGSEKKSPCGSPKPVALDADADEGKTDLKVPPLKIVIPQTTSNEQETGTGGRNGKNGAQRTHQALPYVVASSSNTNDTSEKETAMGSAGAEASAPVKGDDKKECLIAAPPEEVPSSNEAEASAPSSSSAPPVTPAPVPVELHPRKRKMKQSKEPAPVSAEQGETSTDAQVHPHDQPSSNSYQLYLNIRKQIGKRRKGLFPVQPKPPQGFKDYLMNRCTYVLAGTAPTTPNVTLPQSLPSQMKDLFTDQEKERYRLRTQHVIEKEKLVLSVEQEILRVHGRAARALANQSLPFSVCTILRDEEIYNLITPEQEEKDRNARSRYNGRLFLSWLQDVDDKWEKIKEHMLLRHHNEAESMHAVQKMDWEWKMKELSLCDRKSTPKIDDTHVPMVHVSDDFDLLPA